MYFYRQSIVLFGIIIPIIMTAAFISAFFILKAKIQTSLNDKQQAYQTHKKTLSRSSLIEKEVNYKRGQLENWNNQLAQEAPNEVATTIREIASRLPSKEIQQTAFERPNGSSGFGAVSKQNSSQIQIAFRGTYRTMQKTFLELESRIPRLQLQSLKIDPNASQSSLLNFQVTYTAWEK